MISFYILDSSVNGNKKHKEFKAAYAYYNIANTRKLKDLMKNCLILAKNENCDTFNMLDIMENKTILTVLFLLGMSYFNRTISLDRAAGICIIICITIERKRF